MFGRDEKSQIPDKAGDINIFTYSVEVAGVVGLSYGVTKYVDSKGEVRIERGIYVIDGITGPVGSVSSTSGTYSSGDPNFGVDQFQPDISISVGIGPLSGTMLMTPTHKTGFTRGFSLDIMNLHPHNYPNTFKPVPSGYITLHKIKSAHGAFKSLPVIGKYIRRYNFDHIFEDDRYNIHQPRNNTSP